MRQQRTRFRLDIRQKATIAHLAIASLLFPMVVLVSISGGLFLAGIQGSYRIEAIDPPRDAAIDITSPELEEDVKTLLRGSDIEHSFKSLHIEQAEVVPVREDAPEEAPTAGHQEMEEAAHDHDHDHDHDHHDDPEPAEPHAAAEDTRPMITTLTTRPAYKTHFRITVKPDGDVAIEKRSPDLQRRLIGLHRGEAEAPFKYLQYGMAVGLLCVLALGLYMGLSHRQLRRPTAAAAAIGLILFLVLAFVP